MSNFDKWNEIKKQTHKENILVGFKDRDIFYIKMGQNIGFEQNGKGNEFVRPIIILKKFNKEIENIALLSQMRLYSTNRLLNKIGVINKEDCEKLKVKFKSLIE